MKKSELEAMSDFEINCEVAILINPDLAYADESQVTEEEDSTVNFRLCDVLGNELDAGTYNYCNNPSEAWPIIDKNRIDIKFYSSLDMACAKGFINKGMSICQSFKSENENPLKAAMIVFILMKQDKED